MGVDLNGFDANAHKGQSLDPLPAGTYDVQIVDSAIKDAKSGNGRYLEFTFEVVRGEYKGRRLWDRLNIWNTNQDAAEIAKGALSSICLAVGVDRLNNTEQLYRKPLRATVKIDMYQGNPKNEIKGYSPVQQGGAPPIETATEPSPAPPGNSQGMNW